MRLELFITLPDDIIGMIWDLLDSSVRCVTNKNNYERNHSIMYKGISSHNKYTYHRVMIRYDDSYVFERILHEYGKQWLANKTYVYNNTIHRNYLYFMLYLIREYNASRCNEKLTSYLKSEGLCKNLYKKYRTKNIRWTN